MAKFYLKIINAAVLLFIFLGEFNAQSFNDEQTAAINFIKRVYSSSPFEGVKKIDGDERSYFAVAVIIEKLSRDSLLGAVQLAQTKAQILAEQGFAEPCIKFEMIERYEKENQNTYLFLCTTLSHFMTDLLKKKNVDGSKIISAPNNKFVVVSISLENSKYVSTEMRDKTAFMKAKQMINSTLNGSTITSDQIIRTDETDSRTEIKNTEIVKEHSMGFIQGLELLFSNELTSNKTTYVYYSKL
jgi:hypothetical protein